MEGGAPKGRRLDGESGMKKSGGDRLKQAIYESTRAPLARSPFPMRERLRYEKTAFPITSERIHAYVEKNNDGQSLPRVGKVASVASRIGF